MKIDTERLILKDIEKGDIENIHRLHINREVDEFNTLGIPENIEETKKVMQPFFNDKRFIIRKYLCWTIIRKDTNEFIGLCGLNPLF